MAGQPDAADDLIAELAKLMAQDANGDRKAPPSASPSRPVMPVRIPGAAAQAAPTAAPIDFLRPRSATAPEPVADRDEAKAPAADPFHFDFGFQSSTPASRPEGAPAVAAEPQLFAQPAAADPAPSRQSSDYDSIADLISAELAADPAPEPEPELIAQAAPEVPTRPAPEAGPVLMSPTVATAAVAEHGEILGAQRPDQDRFKVPPVFGLGSTAPTTPPPAAPRPVADDASAARIEPKAHFSATSTTPAASAPDVDPIDEIESLIGRAMSVEFDMPADSAPAAESPPVVAAAAPAPRPAPSPALRSLATPTLPTRQPDGLSAADQTIFAAAQASGAKVGWVTEPVATPAAAETEFEAYPSAPRQRRGLRISRALAGPLVAMTLLLAAGFGLYWVLGLGSREDGPAPLLTADSTPTKQAAPAAATDADAPAQSVVFSEMDGATPAADEQLLSRDQTDLNEVTQQPDTASTVSDEGLANRKVRTVKVRPDGTIVSGDDSVAGSSILPVDRPNVPAVPGAETTTPPLLANIDPVTPAAETTTPTPAAVTPVEPGSTVPAVDLAGNPIAGKTAVVPRQRPVGLRMPVAVQATSGSLAAPAAAPVAAATPAASGTPSLTIPGATEVEAVGNTAPAYVQLASQRSEADARQSAQNMVTRYGPLFGGANLEVQRVDLGAKGIYYRVRVPAGSTEQANLICTNVKAAGGDCFVL